MAVEFTAAVIVTGTPQITLRVGGNAAVNLKLANYASGSGTTTLRFSYVVQAADMDDNGIYIEANELVLNGGTIQNTSGTDATLTYPSQGQQDDHKVDGSITEDRPRPPSKAPRSRRRQPSTSSSMRRTTFPLPRL